MTPSDSPNSPGRSRAELIDEFLELQPRMRRRLTRVIPSDLHAEMGAWTVQQLSLIHI